jgi:hypothetical protein
MQVRDAQINTYPSKLRYECRSTLHNTGWIIFKFACQFSPRRASSSPTPVVPCASSQLSSVPKIYQMRKGHGILSLLRRSSSIAAPFIVIVALLWSWRFSELITLRQITLKKFLCYHIIQYGLYQFSFIFRTSVHTYRLMATKRYVNIVLDHLWFMYALGWRYVLF